MARKKSDPIEGKLMEKVATFFNDPYGFTMCMYPWGDQGLLRDETGPDEWQTKTLKEIGRQCREGKGDPVQISVSSGHGVGKTALIAWIILWFMSTRTTPQIVVTANTKEQLNSKTWRELAKWHKLAFNGHWFGWTATKFFLKKDPQTWFASAVPWSKEKSEAFAGTHEKYVLMIFDEASAIEDIIWEVAEGAMTTLGAMWIVFGNPTRNTGRFRETFPGGKFAKRWWHMQVDSRTAKKANKEKIQQWIEDYGEDSDFVRIRVKGIPPRQSAMQLISSEIVELASSRIIPRHEYDPFPIILGVDVARYGDSQTVFIKRRGLATWGLRKFREQSTMVTADLIANELTNPDPDERVDYVMIDVTGIGAGVVDRLKQLGFGGRIIEVGFGYRAMSDQVYNNKRTEIWCRMRDWLKDGGSIPNDMELRAHLIGPEYSFDSKQRLILETKDDMRARDLESPDCADALACTFCQTVFREDDITRQKLLQKKHRGSNVRPALIPRGSETPLQYILNKFKRK